MGKGNFDKVDGYVGAAFKIALSCVLLILFAAIGGALLGVGIGNQGMGLIIAGGVLLGLAGLALLAFCFFFVTYCCC